MRSASRRPVQAVRGALARRHRDAFWDNRRRTEAHAERRLGRVVGARLPALLTAPEAPIAHPRPPARPVFGAGVMCVFGPTVLRVSERPWWRDPRRLDPVSERQREKPLSSTRVWTMRIAWTVLLVGGIVGLAVTRSFSFAFWLLFPIVGFAMLPTHQRRQVLPVRHRT